MRYDETEIIQYVMFGEKEELMQFPVGSQVVTLQDGDGTTQLRPLYLFWDKTDEKVLQIYKAVAGQGTKGFGASTRKKLLSALVKHIQSKYEEVFLSEPEALFLSENAGKEIPKALWRKVPGGQIRLHKKFGKKTALDMLHQSGGGVTLFVVLPKEGCYEEIQNWLLAAEAQTGEKLKDLFLLGDVEQKEWGEDVLDAFYEETGLAGSFYCADECRKLITLSGKQSLLLDCGGLSLQELGRPTYYIDGAGVRTGKEMQRLEGVCEACQSLRKHLDRAFLSAL